jgi:hypothetical protein
MAHRDLASRTYFRNAAESGQTRTDVMTQSDSARARHYGATTPSHKLTAIEAHAKDLLVLGGTANRKGCYAEHVRRDVMRNMFDLASEGRGRLPTQARLHVGVRQ